MVLVLNFHSSILFGVSRVSFYLGTEKLWGKIDVLRVNIYSCVYNVVKTHLYFSLNHFPRMSINGFQDNLRIT